MFAVSKGRQRARPSVWARGLSRLARGSICRMVPVRLLLSFFAVSTSPATEAFGQAFSSACTAAMVPSISLDYSSWARAGAPWP